MAESRVTGLEATESEAQSAVYITAETAAQCPWDGSLTQYEVVLEYQPSGSIVEVRALKQYLDSFHSQDYGQEDLTDAIFEDLSALLEPEWIRLQMTARHAPGVEMETERHRNGG